MDITLPKTGYKVFIRTFVSQDLHEQLEQLGANALGIDLGDAARARNASVELIGEELGIERMTEIQQAATDEQRELLLEEARKELIGKKVQLSPAVGGAHKIDRARTLGMIEEVKDKDGKILFTGGMMKGLEDWLGSLPHQDYKPLSDMIEKFVEEESKDMGKSSALPDASSSASQ